MKNDMTPFKAWRSERGIALITGILLLFLASSLLAGFLAAVVGDTKLRNVDRARTKVFYAAHAGLEKLTSDVGNLFLTDFSPAVADLDAMETNPPPLPNIQFTAGDGLGYNIVWRDDDANGRPDTVTRSIENGPFQGLRGLVTQYDLWVTARSVDGAEARVTRSMNTVSIPVFQFGIFSETDLSFFAGPNFNFGGRVHTNRHLFLASGSTLTLADRVTAFGEVVRQQLANTWPTSSGYTGQVRPITAPGVTRPLTVTEGSVTVSVGSAPNEPTWTNTSIGTYNGNIRNSRTGAKQLSLPLVSLGAQPIDLIRRPVVGENALITGQRMFSQAQVRILLSDQANRITDLPTVSPGATQLGRLADNPIAGYTVDADHAPLAVSSGVAADGYRTPANTPLHGGFLKVEYRDAAGTWNDVTVEILNLGITRRNIDSAGACAEPNPSAVIRIQRVRAVPSTAPGNTCANDSIVETDYWPLALYDTREGKPRDNEATTSTLIFLSGVMHYIELDVNNLRRWLIGEIGVSGPNVIDENGYLVYFSDRRNNRNGINETGELGWEDIVNPGNPAGTPNGSLDTGEDLNGNKVLDTYGNLPVVQPGATAPLTAAATLTTTIPMNVARVNRPIFFRRALKVVNGALGSLPVTGLTITSENPVYVESHFNANAAGFGEPNRAAAIIADAMTMLSTGWLDTRSFQWPNDKNQRVANTTWYRFAVLAGKGLSFPHFSPNYQDYGTDGGVHNFLRFLENWGGKTLNYRGSIVSLYYNHQAVGLYKCCTNVYSPPTRGYNFDTDFLDPFLLPPKTPMFRDINTTSFNWVTQRGQ